MEWLPLLFFLVAFAYSLVGFGGGSSYIALLILFSYSYELAPSLALICNIIVVSGGAWHFFRTKQLSVGALAPFVMLSIPMAYVGGRIPINEYYFQLILASLLFMAAIKMLFFQETKEYFDPKKEKPFVMASCLGGMIGFLSGLVGIGGGIFLAPILYLLRWDRPRQIAAISCGFILVNSIAGLVGQVQKMQSIDFLFNSWSLFLAVLLGGQLGSLLTTQKLPQLWLKRLTSLLILAVSVRLMISSINLA